MEHDLAIWIDVALHFLCGECAFVETRQDQLQLAWIGVDVTDRENARNIRFEFFRINWHNEAKSSGGGYGGVNYIELPSSVTGVSARIVAIVGRPNVGKSSLLNAVCGENRAIVSPIRGTTRDTIDTTIEREGKTWKLLDTAGIRRRGVPPAALRDFVKRIGVAKANSVVDAGVLDFSVREVLNKTALRRMAVLRPLKVVIENYPEGQTEELDAVNHPDDPSAGTRKIKFGREIYVEQEDFMENPPKKFFRLSPGTEVRLRYAYFITCREAIKNAAGEVVELRCTYDPATRGGNAPDGRKVKATIHWVSAKDSVPAEIRIYNQLFKSVAPDPAEFAAHINPQSLEVLSDARVEPTVTGANSSEPMQFERQGYFTRDPDSRPDRPVFNRTVGLRDTFAKEVGGKP